MTIYRVVAKAPLALAAVFIAAGAYGQGANDNEGSAAITGAGNSRKQADAQEQIDDAVEVVSQMKQDSGVEELLEQARGIFIVTDYGKAAAVIGGEGGEGVVLLRQGGQPGGDWSAPAFYNLGGISIGAEAGVEAGQLAMLLMSDKAVDMFKDEGNNFSLNAGAGLTIVNFTAKAGASTGQGDVIVWSDTEGALAGADIGAMNIHRDKDETKAYYGPNVDEEQVFSGNAPGDHAEKLRQALSS